MPWGEWVITSKPLGGVPPAGGIPLVPAHLTGWGSENSTGFTLVIPEPSTFALGVVGVSALVIGCRRQTDLGLAELARETGLKGPAQVAVAIKPSQTRSA